MAERQAGPGVAPSTRPQWATGPPGRTSLVRRLQEQAPNSTQVIGFLTFVVSGAILLLLTGLTLTGAVMALIFFGPIILLSSPIWVPAVFVMFVATVVVLSACGLGVAVLAGTSWLYRYFMGRHPMGSDRVDYARSRIADTATHVKDYAREYSGYLKSRVKDAAPGA
ncbi:oleosin-like [Musa acuminata AAA Group]|uniref:oleosin n=1 Tax=Musa acuminata AAA Group TaxID=214697 RepID=UPI0031DB48B7